MYETMKETEKEDVERTRIQARREELRCMERTSLERLVAGLLDPSHLCREPNATLITVAMDHEFGPQWWIYDT